MSMSYVRAATVSVLFGGAAIVGWPIWTAGVLAWLSGVSFGLAVGTAVTIRAMKP